MKLHMVLTLFSAAANVLAAPTTEDPEDPDIPEIPELPQGPETQDPDPPEAQPQMPPDMSIKDFIRGCSRRSCAYRFYIETNLGEQRCTVRDQADDPANHSWYALPCRENPNWQISWGWNHPDDFTVMTAVNGPGQWEAFFGYNRPNEGLPFVRYPDVGPNPVQKR